MTQTTAAWVPCTDEECSDAGGMKHKHLVEPPSQMMISADRAQRLGEFERFCELQRRFIFQIEDDVLREEMDAALNRMEAMQHVQG